MTEAQRWLLFGAVLVLGSLTAVGALLLWPVPSSSAYIADYEQLWKAIEAGQDGIDTLDRILEEDNGRAWHAAMAAGSAYAEAGDYERAVARFTRAVTLWPTAEARRELAAALESAGRYAEALAHWERLLPSTTAAQAVLRLERDPLSAAQVLNRYGAHPAALEASAALDSPEGRLERARALAGLGRLQEAAAVYEAYLRLVPADSSARVAYGRVLERQGNTSGALDAYRAAGTVGTLSAGRLLEAQGREDEALSFYSRSNDPEALWRAAVLLERRGQLTEALKLYQELAEGSHRVWDDAAIRTYTLLIGEGATQQATALLSRLPPAARWILGALEGSPVKDLSRDPPPRRSDAVQAADALLDHLPESDAWRWIRAELEVADRKASYAERLTIGEWYLAHGDYAAACRIGNAVLAVHPCLRAYRLAYPLAHVKAVRAWADRYAVDPYLVWAVMREESHFRISAVSSSDARGLMQLLPSTARWIAEDRIGISYSIDGLFEPATNIRLGTWYLGYLMEQFPQGIAWAVAAYNGGQGNVRRWTEGGVPLEALPSALGSVETREYLTKVLNSWLIYNWLYGNA